MDDIGAIFRDAERTILALRKEVDELRAEVRRLSEKPCHYCDAQGYHSEDCPVLLDQVAERMSIG